MIVDLFLLFPAARNAFNIIALNKQMLYEYVGSVQVGAKAPQEEELPAPPTTGWIVRGKLTLQRQNNSTLAAAVSEMSLLITKHFDIKFSDLEYDNKGIQ